MPFTHFPTNRQINRHEVDTYWISPAHAWAVAYRCAALCSAVWMFLLAISISSSTVGWGVIFSSRPIVPTLSLTYPLTLLASRPRVPVNESFNGIINNKDWWRVWWNLHVMRTVSVRFSLVFSSGCSKFDYANPRLTLFCILTPGTAAILIWCKIELQTHEQLPRSEPRSQALSLPLEIEGPGNEVGSELLLVLDNPLNERKNDSKVPNHLVYSGCLEPGLV